MVRSVLAVLTGYLAMSFLVLILFATIGSFWSAEVPGAMPPPPVILLILTFGFVAAIVGGFVTASIARHAEAKHVLGLMGFMLVMALVSMRQYSSQPMWYPITLLALGPLGAWLGGRLGIARKLAL
jgi:hypothetical protein